MPTICRIMDSIPNNLGIEGGAERDGTLRLIMLRFPKLGFRTFQFSVK